MLALAVAAFFLVLNGLAALVIGLHATAQRRLHAAYRAHVMLSEANRYAAAVRAREAAQVNVRG